MEVRAGYRLVARGETHKVRNDECGPEGTRIGHRKTKQRDGRGKEGEWTPRRRGCLDRDSAGPVVAMVVSVSLMSGSEQARPIRRNRGRPRPASSRLILMKVGVSRDGHADMSQNGTRGSRWSDDEMH